LALSLPPLAPWWLIVLACMLALIFAKHVYGGVGNNIFNPAMVGYVIVIIAFPAYLSRYPLPSTDPLALTAFEQMAYIFCHAVPGRLSLDAMASATPLDWIKTTLSTHAALPTSQSALLTDIVWINAAYLVGGLFLLQQRLITWQIPLAMLLGVIVLAGPLHYYQPDYYMSPWFHLWQGGTILGAFFIATDPVTAPTTPWGRLIFAFSIGLLTYIIRVFGGYPDGVAFAVLMMNIAAPFIEQYTQPAVFGAKVKNERSA
jgi:electron transport complex protein RnfD